MSTDVVAADAAVPELVGRRVAVLGLGLSGAAALAALAGTGVEAVVAVDTRDTDAVRASGERARARGATVHLGCTDPAVLDGCDLAVTSPGLPLAHPLLAGALARGLEGWSEPELAWRRASGRTQLVAITGTNGKTTTTELAAACLDAPAGGNLGPPLCGLLAVAEPPPTVVAELSSFQLRFSATLRAHVGVLLNLAPDHLDWHPDLADYAASKARVWANQQGEDAAVIFVDDAGARQVRATHPPPARVVPVTLAAPPRGGVGVAEDTLVARLPHAEGPIAALADLPSDEPAFLADAACAAAAALIAGADRSTVGARLAAFRPGPHRLEEVAVRRGVRWINDSKATNPHAAASALAAHPSVVWIAGGLLKGLSLDALGELLPDRVRLVLAIGEGAQAVADLAARAQVPVRHAGTIAEAVLLAAQHAEPGDTVLLSPAAASFDQFASYAARGEAFRDAVAALDDPAREGAR